MENHRNPKKYRYIWMSFSEDEQNLLEQYLQRMAEQGYEVRKIARFYLRFRYREEPIGPLYVRCYRKHYFGHLYWAFSHQPIEEKPSYGSRLIFHLAALLFWVMLLAVSLYQMNHFSYRFLYSDALMVGWLTAPIFCLSFSLDFLGRFLESCRFFKQRHHTLRFAHARALFLGINMSLRYLLLFGLVLPTVLKELRLPVVFLLATLGIYELAYYYLPHHQHRGRFIVGSVLGGIAVCLVIYALHAQLPYQKDQVDYDQFQTMRIEDLIAQEDALFPSGYARQIHRYTSVSLFVPLSFYRQESLHPINQKQDQTDVTFAFSYCQNEAIANYLYQAKCQALHVTDFISFQEADLLGVRDQHHFLVQRGQWIFEFYSSLDLSAAPCLERMQEIIASYSLELLKKY